jgi:mono/diheme cytochrome c family protein
MVRRERAAAGLAALVTVSLCVGLVFAGEPPQKSVHDGVFTASQVESGAKVFEDTCFECHTNDLFGPDYMVGWSGATVGEFYVELQATMPYENPGGLKDDDYADVIAYLFAINGVKAGEEELPSDPKQLEEISIDGPFTWNGEAR